MVYAEPVQYAASGSLLASKTIQTLWICGRVHLDRLCALSNSEECASIALVRFNGLSVDRCRGGFMVGRGRHLLVPRILRPPADVVVCTSHQFQVFSQVWSAEDVDGQ